MYITQIAINNLRSISHLIWEIEPDNAPGWHVILGDNGSGKSTFIRAVALVIIGPEEIPALRQDISSWVRARADHGNISLKRLDLNIEQGFQIQEIQLSADRIYRKRTQPQSLSFEQLSELQREYFSASYGPFRRFTGGDLEDVRLWHVKPLLARHLSAFSESAALTEGLAWLQDLQFKRLEGNQESDTLLTNLFSFINQADFLPNKTRIINISSGGVHFIDGNGGDVLVDELSDGYRSILSLTFDLLRQLSLHYGPNIFTQEESGKVTVKVSGVVQIDEVDAHLHPTWQRRIGFWLREHFPNIQFIVTTHSPLICQAAEKGSIFKLPTPGTEETGRMLVGEERDRLLYGNILDAYSTEAFGSGITRSSKSHEMLERLSDLNLKEVIGTLTQEEESEQEMLRGALPTSASTLMDNTKA